MMRLVVIGYGKMGQIHARAIRRSDSVQLVAVVDPSEPSLPDCPVFRNTDDLVRNMIFDAAVITSPTDTHRKTAEILIRTGIPLMIEKPATGSSQHAIELLDIAQQNRVPIVVSFPERFNPVMVRLREICSGRSLRKLTLTRLTPATQNIQKDGLLRDLTIHDLDLTQWISGMTIKECDTQFTQNDCALTLSGILNASFSFTIHTAIGKYKKRIVSAETDHVLISGDFLSRQLITRPTNSSSDSVEHFLPPSDPAEAQLNEWIHYLSGRKSSTLANLEETIHLLQIIETIEQTNIDFIAQNTYH